MRRWLFLVVAVSSAGCGQSAERPDDIFRYPVSYQLAPSAQASEDPGQQIFLSNNDGWLVVMRVASANDVRWQVILCQLDHRLKPEVTINDAEQRIEVRYGHYFLRESPRRMCVLRQRKSGPETFWGVLGGRPIGEVELDAGQISIITDSGGRWLTASPVQGCSRVDFAIQLRGPIVPWTPDGVMARDGFNSIRCPGCEFVDDGDLLVFNRRPPGHGPIQLVTGGSRPK